MYSFHFYEVLIFVFRLKYVNLNYDKLSINSSQFQLYGNSCMCIMDGSNARLVSTC